MGRLKAEDAEAIESVLAIDPGDKHVGWASWQREGNHRNAGEVTAGEPTWALLDRIWTETGTENTVLVIEEFRLYPDKAPSLSYSRLDTSELIGALKMLARLHQVPWVEQGASIKKPTKRMAKSRAITLGAAAAGPHAADAELHLLHFLMKTGLLQGDPKRGLL